MKRDQIATFLNVYGNVTASQLDLWEATLSPVRGDLNMALAQWLRESEKPAQPTDIVRLMREQCATKETMARIAKNVAEKHQISGHEMRSQRRLAPLVRARQEAMHLMKEAGYSTPQIGRYFRRDHTTVLHGVAMHETRMFGDMCATNVTFMSTRKGAKVLKS